MEDDLRLCGKPSLDEFCHYIEEHGFDLDPYELYNEFDSRGWTNKKGDLAKSWHALINARNSIVCRNNSKKKSVAKARNLHTQNSAYVKSKPQPVRNFNAYVKAVGNWDGSAMGCGYLIEEKEDTFGEGRLEMVGVRSYEAEFRGIVDLLRKIPDNSSVTVYTNQKYLMYLSYYQKPSRDDNFYNLRKALWMEKKRLASVSVVYTPKIHNGVWLNSAADMAEEEFLTLCQTKGIRNQLSYSA